MKALKVLITLKITMGEVKNVSRNKEHYIYLVKQELGHESVTTTEKYAKFSLRRLESDFPSLVNSIKSGEILEMGYEKVGYTSTSVSVNSTILGV